MSRPYQVCTRCIMDTSANEIVFDDDGVCDFCTDFVDRKHHIVAADPDARAHRLAALIARIKRDGRGKKYDCIIGISGGVDSSWVLVKAIELGLRPLAVHMDNGWNSELAQNNIANLVRALDVDLYTHVIDWSEIRGLMEAFFSSDVIDVELLYDNAMMTVNFRQAAKYGVKYILSGSNTATEGMRMPQEWNWNKYDKKNIKAISRQFQGPKVRSFPIMGTVDFLKYTFLNRVKWVSFLDLMEFNKEHALTTLADKYRYKPYAYKHYESVFTRFYQGYILPEKFHVDKRRLHLSTLIMSVQMTRAAAIERVGGIPYPTDRELDADKRYFVKKMNWNDAKLQQYIARPRVPHDHYASEARFFDSLVSLYRRFGMKGGRITKRTKST